MSGRLVRGVVGALLGVGLLASAGYAPMADGAAAVTPEPSPSESAGSTLAVEVDVTQVAPQVLRPGEDLVVRATIRNTSDGELADPRVAVRISRFLLASRSELSRWEDADPSDPAGTSVQSVTLGAPLQPGARAEVEVRVPAAALRLSAAATAWGPRGISLEVTDGGRRRGLARTFALWLPSDQVTPTRVSVAVPLTGDPVEPAQPATAPATGSAAAPAVAPQSTATLDRLDDLLDVTASRPEVGWVVDPALLASLAAAADGGDSGATTGSTDAPDASATAGSTETSGSAATSSPDRAAVDRADRVARAAAGRDVFTLGWLDPDLAALAHAGAADIVAAATDLATSAPLPLLGTPPRTDLAWPANPVPDEATAELAAQAGARAVVVGDDGLAPIDLDYTPTGRATVPVATGELAALVADPVLTAMLADPDGSSPAVAAQRILAETAVVAHERPSDPRHLLLAPDRTWEPDVDAAKAQLAALASAPWVDLAPLSTLIGTAEPDVEREPLPARAVARAELAPASIDALRTARSALGAFATIVADPAAVTEGADAEVLAPVSVAWRADAAGRTAAVDAVVAALTEVTSAVSAVPGSSLNVISQSGTFPVGLRNDLDQEVTVRVSLVPENKLLIVDGVETVTVPAQSQVQARIPFTAVGSGDVPVSLTLLAPDGSAISSPGRFTVRVRADWENVGTGVLAGGLGIAFVIGIVRTIRRGQTTRRGASEAEIAKIADPRELPS